MPIMKYLKNGWRMLLLKENEKVPTTIYVIMLHLKIILPQKLALFLMHPSSKPKEESLNDCLLKVPNILEEIPTVPMKFRKEEIGEMVDIKKVFLQISEAKPDCEYLKFLRYGEEVQRKVF